MRNSAGNTSPAGNAPSRPTWPAQANLDPETAWTPWEPTEKEPWDHRRASHLIRRAGFGTTWDDLGRLVDQGVEATLDELFALKGREAFDTEMKPMERVLASSQDPQQLASWWLLRLRQTPCQLLEKTMLFWHGHFATGAEKVDNSPAMLAQNELFRQHALGKFEPLVQGISKDVAMLIYLDSEDNRKTRPNENYARELMELFCLGPGNYTEKDIKELARCFTGWQIFRGRFRFNPNQHDNGQISLLDQSGTFSGEEAIRIVLDQEAAPRFLARKLIRYFVVEDHPLDDGFIEPVAATIRQSDFDMGAAIRTILASRFFYSDRAIGHKVRSPVEMAIGLLRTLDATTNMNQLRTRLFALGHLPMYPPNVKGWEGGRNWINASTYFGRANLVRKVVSQGKEHFNQGSIAESISAGRATKPEVWIRRILDCLVPVPVPDKTMKQLVEFGSQSGTDIDQRVVNVISAIGATPEYQLN